MAHTSLPKTVHIIYGWAEGPWHAKQLLAALREVGFVEAPKHTATIVIAHSAGCFFVPPDSGKQMSILVGFPIWPGKSLIKASVQKLWLDATTSKPLDWLLKTGWYIFYIILHPYLRVKEWRALRGPNPFLIIPDTALLIRNEDETFCTPLLSKIVENTVINLPGQHDDLWIHPERYVKITQETYARLLA